jgi:protein TonB
MYLGRQDNRILLAFLTLSLLLHLLIIFLVPEMTLFPKPESSAPVYVEMRAPAQPRELDLPKQEDQPRETEAKRLGPSDRVVEKEIAPKGDFIEDRIPAAPVKPQPQSQPIPEPKKTPAETGDVAKQPATPDLAKLLTLPSTTVNRLDDQLRTKYRAEVEEGDSIWLDTEKDILISFYQRLRSGIYRVWNYPSKSKEQGETGICLIRMSFNRDGTIKDVELLESTGFPRLDREAVAAVYKGGPYGKLPEAYKEEDLSILAFFRYTMSRNYISN